MSQTVLAMGAGVQTTGMMAMWWKKYQGENKTTIFCDTQDEWPETYDYFWGVLVPFMNEKKINWRVLSSPLGALYDYCIKENTIPMRNFRWCTDKWKTRQMAYYEKFILNGTTEEPIPTEMGISLDESHRVKEINIDDAGKIFNIHKDYPWQKRTYPLLDEKITRDYLKEEIKKMGWAVPRKSGCFYCPYMKKRDIQELITRPAEFQRTVALEENNDGFKDGKYLRWRPIRSFKQGDLLDNYMDTIDECDEGFCGV